jgi:hypothetical protein
MMGMEMGPSEGNYIMRVEPWSDKSSDHEISEGLFSLSLALSLFLSLSLIYTHTHTDRARERESAIEPLGG